MLKSKPLDPSNSGTPTLVEPDGASDAPLADQYFTRAVGKALEVVECLQGELKPLSMNEIGQRIQLSKNAALRILRTLEALGCAVVDHRGYYQLAPGIHAVAPTQWLGKLHRLGMPYLEALSRELEETSTLAMLFQNRIEVIAVVESPNMIRMSHVVGQIVPPHASALGKLLTAFQPPEQREKLLRSFGTNRFTPNTMIDRRELVREFDTIRAQGYGVDREESAQDGVSFCAPIVGLDGQVTAAISASLPKSRLRDEAQEDTILSALRAAADQLSEDLKNA